MLQTPRTRITNGYILTEYQWFNRKTAINSQDRATAETDQSQRSPKIAKDRWSHKNYSNRRYFQCATNLMKFKTDASGGILSHQLKQISRWNLCEHMKTYLNTIHFKAKIIWLYSAQRSTRFPAREMIQSLAKHWEISREIMTELSTSWTKNFKPPKIPTHVIYAEILPNFFFPISKFQNILIFFIGLHYLFHLNSCHIQPPTEEGIMSKHMLR